MGSTSTAVYEALARLPVPRGYRGKVVALAALGVQLPLVALAAYFALVPAGSPVAAAATPVLLVAAAATLLGTVGTAVLVRGMLAPLARATAELQGYLNDRRLPDAAAAPARRVDMAGCLLRGVRYATARLEELTRAQEAGAETDALTGVYGRAAGEQRLREEVARGGREGTDVALAVVDLDYFEALTGRYGHGFVDDCLRQLARALLDNLRASDWVARQSGRAFMLGLAGAAEEDLMPVLGRIYRALEAAPVSTPDGRLLRLSVSVGVARMERGDGPADLIGKAEQALRRAKVRGRDTAVFHAPEADGPRRLAA